MNQTLAVKIWDCPNRLSQLWEELSASYVSPDPLVEENTSTFVDLEPSLFLKIQEREEDSLAAASEQNESPKTSLLEKAGFESLRLFREALEILSAPSEELVADTHVEQDRERLPANQGELSDVRNQDFFQADTGYIKVSSEPEPQPGSAIDTRRMAYGLKIPSRPLHKRPMYQRLFFCVHSWIRTITRQGYEPSPR